MVVSNQWHSISFEEAVNALDSHIESGLSHQEALLRQEKFGKNQLPEEKPLSRARIFFGQLKDPLIYILIIAGSVTFFLKEWADTAVIFTAVVLNSLFGFFQENKANRTLNELKKVVKVSARVMRNGNEKNIDSADLVPGDIIFFTAGNKIPADARLIESHHLAIGEAALTGESAPAQKRIDVLPGAAPLADRDNMVYLGSTIINGKGKAVVTAIGKNAEIGKIAILVKETQETKTPLQQKIAHLGKVIGIVVMSAAFLIFIEGILKGRDFFEMFMTSVALAVAAIPEGLPIAFTVILALGTQRILKRKGLVRKLAAAEALGSTSVIASDKTLTLTQGQMLVSETIAEDRNLLFQIAVLTSEAFIENPNDPYPLWIIDGRPTDKAIILAGAEMGLKKPVLERAFAKIDEIPFNSENKFIAVLVKGQSGQEILVAGAPEKILAHSSIAGDDLLKLNNQLNELAGKGLRVVAIAYKKISDHKTEIANLGEEIGGLTFAGFIGLKDPLRPEAKEAILLCRKAGMKPIIVTGDHLLTARAVARELDLKTGDENIIEGRELDQLTDDELQKRIKDIDVYARVEPHHKLRIIEAWQKQGKVVAMTGDGINDTPALKKADIGVALGSGTDVAKEVSDLVLLTDNFNVLVAAVEEGRAIVDNIRKVITYLLSDSFTETILIGFSIIFGLPLPVTAAQILWVNLIEDGFPNMALAFEPKEKDLLTRAPEARNVKLLTPEMKSIIFIIGFATDLILLGVFWWLLGQNYDIQYIRTIIFAALGIDSLFYVFSCRNLRQNIWRVNPFSNKFLTASVIFGFSALIAGIYIPVFRTLLKTVPLRIEEWLIVIGLGFLNLALIELVKYIFIAKRQKKL